MIRFVVCVDHSWHEVWESQDCLQVLNMSCSRKVQIKCENALLHSVRFEDCMKVSRQRRQHLHLHVALMQLFVRVKQCRFFDGVVR
jgi:hypothetical protein